MRQVIMNLVSNAIKFTKEGGITVKTRKNEDNFAVDVIDTGIGIKEDDMQNIFNEFVQADGSITREFGGTGLGLSISKRLLTMMQGKIEVESQWKKGTTFRIILQFGFDNTDLKN